jgi:3-hydroxyisobutyrate dehydrogenase-like beta-hydroxyacid dehydrogenase
MTDEPTLGFIDAGSVGTAFAGNLSGRGYRVVGVYDIA